MNEENKAKLLAAMSEMQALLREVGESELSPSVRPRLAQCWRLLKGCMASLQAENEAGSAPPEQPRMDAGDAGAKASAAQVPAKAAAPAPAPELAPLIAVIDDDADVQRMVSFFLKRKAFRVVGYVDPKLALGELAEHAPDLILLDLMMPRMTGFEFLDAFRALRGVLPRTKIIVGSARSFDSDRLAVLKAGANDFVAKPYNIEELVLRIRNLLDE